MQHALTQALGSPFSEDTAFCCIFPISREIMRKKGS